MAFGAKEALKEISDPQLENVFVLGCDGLPQSGQSWVKKGLLKATVVVPVLAGIAVEMLVRAFIEEKAFPEHTIIAPKSYPSLSELESPHR